MKTSEEMSWLSQDRALLEIERAVAKWRASAVPTAMADAADEAQREASRCAFIAVQRALDGHARRAALVASVAVV